MPDLRHENQTPGGQSAKGFLDEVKVLLAVLESVIKEVDDLAENLRESYPKQALQAFSVRFEEISKDFTNYTARRADPLYEIVRRSKDRRTYAGLVANEAKKLAQLFEKCAKVPQNYSRTTSRIQINKLQAQLENMKHASLSDTHRS